MPSEASDSSAPSIEEIMHHHYVPFQLPDPSTRAGKSIAQRLHDDLFIWLTTVDAEGTPHPLPVGFVWDEAQGTFLIYSATSSNRERLAHIWQNPRVSLHFDRGGDLLIITGEASVSASDPPSDQQPAWVQKYEAFFSRLGMTLRQAAEGAPVALRVRPLLLRYLPNPFPTEHN